MSEHGSGTYSFDPENGVPVSNENVSLPHEAPMTQEARTTTSSSFNFELDVDLHQRQGGGGGGGGGGGKAHKISGASLEERARYLSQPTEAWHRPPQPPPPSTQVPDSTPVAGQVAPHAAPTTYHPPPPVTLAPPSSSPTASSQADNAPRPTTGHDPPGLVQGFLVDNAMMTRTQTSTTDPNDPWMAAGSLKPLDNEQVLLRCAGSLADVFQIYHLVSYIMLTHRRIVIKQRSKLCGMNLFTVEASFLYENLRHITVQRVTNFRFLWGGIGALFISIIFFGLGAVIYIYALLGIALFCGGFFAIYWFFIFYNSNSVVMDFSKGDLVGSWVTTTGKGAFITKSLILHIDHCFEVMYGIYDQARCIFANNNV